MNQKIIELLDRALDALEKAQALGDLADKMALAEARKSITDHRNRLLGSDHDRELERNRRE